MITEQGSPSNIGDIQPTKPANNDMKCAVYIPTYACVCVNVYCVYIYIQLDRHILIYCELIMCDHILLLTIHLYFYMLHKHVYVYLYSRYISIYT